MTIQGFSRLLLRRWRLVGLAILLGGLTGLIYESIQPRVVATEGRLLIGPSLEGDLNVIESTGSLSRGTLQRTLAEIITGNQVAQAARAEVGNASSAYQLASVVIPETNLVKLTVTGPDGDEVMALASAVMSEAQQAFEQLYPVYAIAVVDQPDDWTQTAPDPEFGLLLGALIGASLAAIGIAAIDASDRRRQADDDTADGGPRGEERADASDRYRVLLEELEDLLGLDRAEWLQERLADDRPDGHGEPAAPADDLTEAGPTTSGVHDRWTTAGPEEADDPASPRDAPDPTWPSTGRDRPLGDPDDVTPRTG